MAVGSRNGSLYYLDCDSHAHQSNVATGHLSVQGMLRCVNAEMCKWHGCVNGMDLNSPLTLSFCESCVEGKSHRLPFQQNDVCGLGGAEYFVNDCVWKNEVFSKSGKQQWKNRVDLKRFDQTTVGSYKLNGVAKWSRTLIEGVRTMLQTSS